eukprot:gnl/Dysnectes_brevis/3182_a3974_964.p1 GENE.gnl/Dysnectes_brevis/3182_a3974_964~~gnl/Dysnectes_brevis/3182_a3974_964.p1  ORF type:complete len:282 (+),score=48.11 gnl/Dysnectes_brevis/3182_a3974_964:945-1790(+)
MVSPLRDARTQQPVPYKPPKQSTFERIRPIFHKGTVISFLSFVIFVTGLVLSIVNPSIPVNPLYSWMIFIGGFSFVSGLGAVIACRGILHRSCCLYGTGIVQREYLQVRELLKSVVMSTFFDKNFLETYLFSDVPEGASEHTAERLQRLFDSPDMNEALSLRVQQLIRSSRGMAFQLMGISAQQMTQVFKPLLVAVICDAGPQLMGQLNPLRRATPDVLRDSVNRLLATKMAEFTPNVVSHVMSPVFSHKMGWLVVWACFFGAMLGAIAGTVELVFRHDLF